MKKSFFLLFPLFGGIYLYGTNIENLNKALEQAESKARISFASQLLQEKSILPLTIKTQEVKTYPNIRLSGQALSFSDRYSYHCPAVKIHDNWLAVSAHCLRDIKGQFISFQLGHHMIDRTQIIGLERSDLSVALIFIPSNNPNYGLSNTLKDIPSVAVLALPTNSSAQDIISKKYILFVNRQCLCCFKRTCEEVQPDITCRQDSITLTLQNKFVNADFGDPLFTINLSGQTFLTGFNISHEGFSGHSGRQYTLFTSDDFNFILESISTFTPDIQQNMPLEKYSETF